MAKPTKEKIRKWFKIAFGREPREDYYIDEWYERFEYPKLVWGKCDSKRRKALKKVFPSKFKGLPIGANLYNEEYKGKKYSVW